MTNEDFEEPLDKSQLIGLATSLDFVYGDKE